MPAMMEGGKKRKPKAKAKAKAKKTKGGNLSCTRGSPLNWSQELISPQEVDGHPQEVVYAHPQDGGKKKKKRKPSAYNKFMATEIKKQKKLNPKLDHKAIFKKAASNWNPK